MADDSGIDPRYAAQFQRGYDSTQDAAPPVRRGPVRLEGGPPSSAPRVPDPPPIQPAPLAVAVADPPGAPELRESDGVSDSRRPRVVLVALGAGLVALAVGCATAASLAPLSVNGQPEVATYLMRTAPGPLLVAGVLAVTLWAFGPRPSRPRIAKSALFGAAGMFLLLLVGVGSELTRLAGLTAQGPVSSGGIALSDEAMAMYFQRVQTAAMLGELLPWLILAATGALVGAVALAVAEVSPRSPERAP